MVRIYTRTGDDGTTGLLFGGRVRKDSAVMQLNGAVDEAQAALGVARAETADGSDLDVALVALERDLYVLMAEVATDPAKRDKLAPGATLVTEDMVTGLERRIDEVLGRVELPAEFVVPGANRASAALDLARTIVRRAERLAVSDPVPGSFVPRYLNRLSDLLWALARAAEGEEHLLARRRTGQPGRARHARSGADPEAEGTSATDHDEGGDAPS